MVNDKDRRINQGNTNMRAQTKIAGNALLAGAAWASFIPAAVGQDNTVDGDPNDDEVIAITPDMDPNGASQLLDGRPNISPPDGSSATIPADRAVPASGPPSVLAIFAHPDDEITVAPVLSRIAREGGDVTVIFATSGDAGPGLSGLQPGQELAELRESEARCSAFALGLPEPIFWQLGDGRLSALAREQDSTARDLTARIQSIIALKNPGVVMTWGPDGGYGHADHRMVSNAITQIVQALDDNRPDLLYAAIPASDLPNLPGFEGWATLHPSLITDRIRYEVPDLDATRIAVDCYQSQFDAAARASLPTLLHQNLWQGTVYFRLAFPSPS